MTRNGHGQRPGAGEERNDLFFLFGLGVKYILFDFGEKGVEKVCIQSANVVN